MTFLEDQRRREHARKLSRTWAAAAGGQSGLPSQMLPVRQGGVGQPLVLGGQQRSDGSVSVGGETVTLAAVGVATSGQVSWATVVRGEGFAVEQPNPIAGFAGYYDFHVRVVTNGDPLRGLTISATGAETVTTDPTPFCTEWRGTVAHVLATPGDPLTIDLGWTGSADVDVELTVGLVEPIPQQVSELIDVHGFTEVRINGNADRVEVTVPADTQDGDLLVVTFPIRGQAQVGDGLQAASPWQVLVDIRSPSALSSQWHGSHYVLVRPVNSSDAETVLNIDFDPGNGGTYEDTCGIALSVGGVSAWTVSDTVELDAASGPTSHTFGASSAPLRLVSAYTLSITTGGSTEDPVLSAGGVYASGNTSGVAGSVGTPSGSVEVTWTDTDTRRRYGSSVEFS